MTRGAWKKADPRALMAAEHHFKSWSAALTAAGLDPERYRKHIAWTDERILAAIRDIHHRHGYVTASSVKAVFRHSLQGAIYRRGWTISKARALAGLPATNMSVVTQQDDEDQRHFVVCRLCGHRFQKISSSHLRSAHGFGVRNRHPILRYKKIFKVASSWSDKTRIVTRRALHKTLRLKGCRWTTTRVIEAMRQMAQHGQEMNWLTARKTNSRLERAAVRRFGDWDTALRAAGLDPKGVRKHKKWSLASVIDAIRRRNRQGKKMNAQDTRREESSMYYTAIRLLKNWDAALRAAKLDPKRIRLRRKRSPEIIMKAIVRRWKRGEAMNAFAVRKTDPRLLSSCYAYYPTWSDALKSAGLDADHYKKNIAWTDDKILEAILDIFRRHGKVVKSTIGSPLEHAIYRRGWTIPQARAMAGVPDKTPIRN